MLPVSKESQWGGGGVAFWGEEEKGSGRTARVYEAVSKQKKQRDRRRQPMGCGRGSTELEMVEGCGGGGVGEAIVGGRERGRFWYFYPVTSR